MNIWFISDLHLGHKNIIKYSNRPFSSVNEMDDLLIENWNSLIREDDIVFHVGDFTLRDSVFANDCLAELNGYIRVMQGSHDSWIDENKNRGYVPYAKKHPVSLFPPVYTYESEKYGVGGFSKPIVLCHYAMRSWDRSHYGSWHLFGHHHGNLEPYGLSFDIGVDSHDFKPWNIDEVAERMKTLKPIVDFSKGNK